MTNGAIINELAHRYMHSLPRSQEEVINDYIREWKKRYYEKCEIELAENLNEDFEIDLAELELVPPKLEVKKFNRAKTKRETKELIQEYYERED